MVSKYVVIEIQSDPPSFEVRDRHSGTVLSRHGSKGEADKAANAANDPQHNDYDSGPTM